MFIRLQNFMARLSLDSTAQLHPLISALLSLLSIEVSSLMLKDQKPGRLGWGLEVTQKNAQNAGGVVTHRMSNDKD